MIYLSVRWYLSVPYGSSLGWLMAFPCPDLHMFSTLCHRNHSFFSNLLTNKNVYFFPVAPLLAYSTCTESAKASTSCNIQITNVAFPARHDLGMNL